VDQQLFNEAYDTICPLGHTLTPYRFWSAGEAEKRVDFLAGLKEQEVLFEIVAEAIL
jgi:hypothetical protein